MSQLLVLPKFSGSALNSIAFCIRRWVGSGIGLIGSAGRINNGSIICASLQFKHGTYQGIPIGYCELVQEADGSAQIGYFGLLPQWYGQGLGGLLLTKVIQQAWQLTSSRVWLHTCTLDGPTALANYQARGFKLYDQKTEVVELPSQAAGPWLGAYSNSI